VHQDQATEYQEEHDRKADERASARVWLARSLRPSGAGPELKQHPVSSYARLAWLAVILVSAA